MRRGLAAAGFLTVGLASAPAAAVPAPVAPPAEAMPRIQTPADALAQDAGEYARQLGVPVEEAKRRLRIQEASAAATEIIRQTYRDRLAGVSIEHRPDYRIVVLLTGDAPVPGEVLSIAGAQVPLHFRMGARATEEQIVSAMVHHRAALRTLLPRAAGMGVDPRTGELVLMVRASDAARIGEQEIDARAETITGVPVRVRVLDRPDEDSAIQGGARVVGVDPANGRRYACTTGFTVTDGTRAGVVTAAHCPDEVTYLDGPGGDTPLQFAGQWGWGFRDVQVHVSPTPHRPLFFADSRKTSARAVLGARSRTSTRAGDFVCRRGETTGYSCAQVELVNYAPPGELCGGPCDPTWVTVPGPQCKAGDSGAPVFLGNTAFGIVKGGNYSRDGTCNFYYYMSMDYLPEGWALLRW